MNTAPRNVLHTTWPRAVLTALGACLIVGVVLLGFAWPSVTASPKNLPVGIVGSDAQVTQVEKAIAEKADGAVRLSVYDDRAAAVAAIKSRHAYGAIVLGAAPTDAPEILTSSAASTAAAQLLQGLGTGLQAQIDAQIRSTVEKNVQKAAAAGPAGATALQKLTIPTVTVVVNDVVPLTDSDPRGTGIAAAMFPLTLGGMLGAMVVSFAIKGSWRRLAGLAVYAVGAGLVLTSILQAWFGALQGDFLTNAAAIALSIAAVSAPIVGLYSLIGAPGLGLGAGFTLLIANPLSAATMPVEFLATPWGSFGQALAPGAAGTLIRTLSYFPDAATGTQWTTLAIWAGAGLLLLALSGVRRPASAAAGLSSTSSAQPATA
ncbi:hypothetical protein LXM50_10325 [Microbacterium sp. Au-Mic1]|uniref:hypothetical protein n=1 Tax=Microbacterium sp. Au-Mic1 TaxID=2906457 RepID=UPI001E35C098|nr:hypothetical protein [Microbacterium sp. Au-Mic1]MCE4026365.1 hypothetical protein [Microbacterium sp. Au-Mic1]